LHTQPNITTAPSDVRSALIDIYKKFNQQHVNADSAGTAEKIKTDLPLKDASSALPGSAGTESNRTDRKKRSLPSAKADCDVGTSEKIPVPAKLDSAAKIPARKVTVQPKRSSGKKPVVTEEPAKVKPGKSRPAADGYKAPAKSTRKKPVRQASDRTQRESVVQLWTRKFFN
jgi:hypothetical protein